MSETLIVLLMMVTPAGVALAAAYGAWCCFAAMAGVSPGIKVLLALGGAVLAIIAVGIGSCYGVWAIRGMSALV